MSLHRARGVGRGQELGPGFSCCFSTGMQRGAAPGCSHRASKSPPNPFFLPFLLCSRALNPTKQRDVAWPWPQRCAGPVLRPPRTINGKKRPNPFFPDTCNRSWAGSAHPQPPQKAPMVGVKTVVSHPCAPMGSKTQNPRQMLIPGPLRVHPGSERQRATVAELKTSSLKASPGRSPSLHRARAHLLATCFLAPRCKARV